MCSIHTEVVIHDRGNGLIDCVGGNVNQGVRKTVRSLGGDWDGIVIPDILQGSQTEITVYGFDDPHYAPERKGPWHDRAARENVIHAMPMPDQRWVRRIRLHGKNQYAFEILSPDRWRYGPWEDKAVRDQTMHGKQQATKRSMRPWSQPVQEASFGAGHGTTTSGESVK